MAEADVAALAGIHIFAALRPETVAELAAACRPVTAPAGEIVVREKAAAGSLFLIRRGRVAVVKGAGTPAEVTLAELGPGEFFGEMGIIDPSTRSATIRAVQSVSLLSLERADLLRVFERSPKEYAVLVTNIARDLCRRLRAMDELFAARAY